MRFGDIGPYVSEENFFKMLTGGGHVTNNRSSLKMLTDEGQMTKSDLWSRSINDFNL